MERKSAPTVLAVIGVVLMVVAGVVDDGTVKNMTRARTKRGEARTIEARRFEVRLTFGGGGVACVVSAAGIAWRARRRKSR